MKYREDYQSTRPPEFYPKKTLGEIIDGIVNEPPKKPEELLKDNSMVDTITGLVNEGVLKKAPSSYEANVSHPSHYADRKIEVIDYIEDCGFGEDFCLGNVIKYVSRAGHKDPSKKIEDLQKAQWYLNRCIDTLLKENN